MVFDKKFEVGGVKMALPIILGAGAAKHPNQVNPYLQQGVQIGAAISGSYTLNPLEGNKGSLSWPSDLGELISSGFALNAYGMPNIGLSNALGFFAKNITPHIISIAGFCVEDYVCMLEILKGVSCISGVEINAGCPNTGHLPAAYDIDQLESLLIAIRGVKFDKPIWLKLSPFMTEDELVEFSLKHSELDLCATPVVEDNFVLELCDFLLDYVDVVKAIVMTNTIPNVGYGTSITVQKNDGSIHNKGGLSGSIIRKHNIKLIQRIISQNIDDNIDIIGCGGIMNGGDALDYLMTGCVAVQCTSGPNWSGSPKFFSDLIEGSEGLQKYIFSRI